MADTSDGIGDRIGQARDQTDDGTDRRHTPVAHDDSPGVLEAQNLLVHLVPFKELWRPLAESISAFGSSGPCGKSDGRLGPPLALTGTYCPSLYPAHGNVRQADFSGLRIEAIGHVRQIGNFIRVQPQFGASLLRI